MPAAACAVRDAIDGAMRAMIAGTVLNRKNAAASAVTTPWLFSMRLDKVFRAGTSTPSASCAVSSRVDSSSVHDETPSAPDAVASDPTTPLTAGHAFTALSPSESNTLVKRSHSEPIFAPFSDLNAANAFLPSSPNFCSFGNPWLNTR